MTLRLLFFLSLSGIAVLPVVAFGIWIFTDALTREINSVVDKHLVIARNVGEALERYSVDLRNGFDFVATMPLHHSESPAALNFLTSLNFVHFCFADVETGTVVASIEADQLPCPDRIPAERFATFLNLANDDQVVFSPVMKNPLGQPVFYLLRIYGDRLVVGAVRTTYIVEQGKTVSFGQKGHAAIVDQTGHVIAHPLPEWEASIKDISVLDPVQRMLAGETGTAQFFSPALKAEMVTGFTAVPTPGWGVMVPQPLSEIRQQAKEIQWVSLLIGVVGAILAALFGWLLSGYLSRNMQTVVDASKRMAKGDFDARANLDDRWKPIEIREVIETFDMMAQELSASNTKLVNALSEADAANRAKTEFLAVTSHELRTPLNAIIGFSEAVINKMHGDINEKYWDYAHDIHSAGQHLHSLINDVLLISKSGSIRRLEEENVSAAALLDAMVRIHASQAKTNGIDLAAIPPMQDFSLLIDERMVRQALINLITNAIKFTENGGQVKLSAEIDEGGASFHVEDTGIGIEEDELQNIWTPFHQIGNPLIRNHEGSGLGLAIVDTIARAHGGAVAVTSSPGKGSRFTIRFPVVRTGKPD